MQMRKTMLGGSSSDKSSSKDNSNSSSSSMSLLKRSSSSSSAASDADRKGDKGSKDGSADVNSNDFPPVMAKFLATRGAARGRTTKSAVELQEQINQRSKKISGRWADLEKQWRALEKERKDSASTYGVVGGGGAIVELNVGGTDMDVLRTDLVRAEDSVLANMFSGRWEGRLPRDSRGRVFVDVSPTSFRKVVGFLVKLGIATPGKVLELPTLTPDEQPAFDHLVLVLGLWPHVYEGKAAATVTGPSLQKQAEDELVRAPPVEPSDAKRFGQAVAQSFAAEEIALEKAAVELEEARERFDKEVESITKFAGAPAGFGGQHNMGSANQDDIVELNIGGTMAATRRSTLCRAADSVLARMFDHSNESRAPPFVRDAKGRYFVQYNDYCFAKIIEVLRSKRWPWPPTNTQLKEFGVGSLETSGATTERFKTFIRDDEREDFGSLVSYFFPGCERFIMEAVGRPGSGAPKPVAPVQHDTSPPPPASSSASKSRPKSTDVGKVPHPTPRSSRSQLPSEIAVLEIRVGRVKSIKALPRKTSHFVISVQVYPDKKADEEFRTVLWHFDTPPPQVNSPVTVLCNLPYIKFEGTLFTAVILCMDDDLLLPPRDAPVGELVTVKNHPPTPSRNGQAVSVVWEKVLNDELLQVGHDEVVRFEHKKYPGPLMTSKGPITCK